MRKMHQTEEQLTSELAGLRQKIAGLKTIATEQKRLEEALQDSQQVLRKIFESVTDGIPDTDLGDIVTGAKLNKK